MTDITVFALKPGDTLGVLDMGDRDYPCTLGRSGIVSARLKREGDGATPAGTWQLRQVLYRADRLERPVTGLPISPLLPEDGWCEDINHPDYNRLIKIPHPAVTDRMTRDDHLYDIVVVIGYNDSPVETGMGSAIFMHLARPDFTPTAGCIGLSLEHLREILVGLDHQSTITILEPEMT